MKNKTQRSRSRTGLAEGYLHGFTTTEQDRLFDQARFLEAGIYDTVDFENRKHCLEVGSGVGAQTEILLRRFPGLKISGVDASATQVKRARKHIASTGQGRRVDYRVGDALCLPFKENTFDSAFLCWFLEHVQQPVEILKDVRRVLSAGAVIHCCEVQNASFFVHPYSPATLKYWYEYNDWQWSEKGDPFAGAKLGNFLLAAGFQNIRTQIKTAHYDSRAPKRRAEFIEYWTSLLLSGAAALIGSGRVDQKLVQQMTGELEVLKHHQDAVFYYSWVQARAEVY